jgi:hypothetical protein
VSDIWSDAPLAIAPTTASPQAGVLVSAVAAASLSRRVRRVALGTMTVGGAGAVLFVFLIGVSGSDLAEGLSSVRSEAVREFLFSAIPVALVIFFVLLATAGRRVWLTRNLLGDDLTRTARSPLKLVRGLLVVGMPLCVFGTVIGLLGSEVTSILAVGAPQAAAFVASAILATRVRDLLADLRPPQQQPPQSPIASVASAPDALPDTGENVPMAAVAVVALPAPETLQYAMASSDEARDFLRLFDLLAIYAAVVHGLGVPGLADTVAQMLTGAGSGMGTVNWFEEAANMTRALVEVASLVVALGWAIWAPAYVAFGAVLYRTGLALATTGLAAALIGTGLVMYEFSHRAGDGFSRAVWLGPALQGWLFPCVMLFCLTRARVRAAFVENAAKRRGTS